MQNIYRAFLDLLPARPLQLGTIVSVDGETATIELPGGGVVAARGAGGIGDQVFVRDGVIEAAAPDMPIDVVEI